MPAFHLPILEACTVSASSFQEAIITKRSLAPAQPHKLASEFCCNTMPLLKIGGSLIIASALKSNKAFKIKKQLKQYFFMYMLVQIKNGNRLTDYHVLLLITLSSSARVMVPNSGCFLSHSKKATLISSVHWLSISPVL